MRVNFVRSRGMFRSRIGIPDTSSASVNNARAWNLDDLRLYRILRLSELYGALTPHILKNR